MDLVTLRRKLEDNNVPKSRYSIDEGLKIGALNLYKNYSKWEYFYLNERTGDRDGLRVFFSEEEAFDYLWEQIEWELKHPPSIPPKSIFGKL